MSFSRRDFLLAGSAASTLWLTGCGGGGSADGAPKPGTSVGGGGGSTATCSLTQATLDAPALAEQKIVFSNATGFADAGKDFIFDSTVQNLYNGTTNQFVTGSEGFLQELFVSYMQPLPASQTASNKLLLRNLRLHLSIPHDTSGDTLQSGYTFNVGDPTSAKACELFSGSLIVTDPTATTNSTWAYQIVSGTVQIVGPFSPLSGYLKLNNVVATAAAAGVGSGINAAGSSDRVEMNGYVLLQISPILTLLG